MVFLSLSSHNNVDERHTHIPAIRKAAQWYTTHLQTAQKRLRQTRIVKVPTVVLMTDDNANRIKARDEGGFSLSGMSFFPFLP